MGCVELGEGVNTITTTFGCEGVQNREFFVGLRSITFTRPYSITADTNAAAIKNGVIQRIDTNGDTSSAANTGGYIVFNKLTCKTNDDTTSADFNAAVPGWYSLYAKVEGKVVLNYFRYYSFYFDNLTVNGNEVIPDKSVDYIAVPAEKSPYQAENVKICNIYLEEGENTVSFSIYSDRNANELWMYSITAELNERISDINVGLYYPSGSEVTWVEPGENVILKGDFDSNAVDGVNIYTTCYINGVLAETYIDKLSTIKENIKIDESYELRSFTVPQCDKIVVYVWDDNLQPLASAKIINNRKPQEAELYVNAEIGSDTIWGFYTETILLDTETFLLQ